jgi:hypothetical protein
MPSLGLTLSLRGNLLSSGAAPTPAFDPTTLFTGTDTGWVYDLSDMSTLFQDAAGTTPVTAVGQPVGRCLDLSGKGNHRTQSTALNRPTYARHPLGGIRNLLTRTEEFNDAAWVKPVNSSVTANSTVAPNGTTTADTYSQTSAIAPFLHQNITLASAGPVTAAIRLKASVGSHVRFFVSDTATFSNGFGGWVNVSTQTMGTTGTFGSGATFTSATVSDLGDGWCLLRFSGQAGSNTSVSFGLFVTTADNSTTRLSPASLFVWGAQLELGSTATAYQRVGSTFDVTEAGVEDLYYLSYDGINDSLATASFAWGTDKATVVAGVRKLSDVNAGVVVETSANASSNSGAFTVSAPATNGTESFGFRSNGTTLRALTPSGFPAPTTQVLAGIADISAPSVALRVGGSEVSQSTASQGTGNFLTYPAYFGARAGTSVFFNGREYSNVGINRLLTTDELAALENWTAGKNGVNLANILSPTVFARDDTAVLDRFNQTIERRAS